MFDVVKTIEQVKKVVAEFGGVSCEKVNSLRGVARYLCHLDNLININTTKVKSSNFAE